MTITKYLNAAGGYDYTTLSAAIDAWEADETDTDWVIKVYDGNYTDVANMNITAAPIQANKTLTIEAETADSTSVHFDTLGNARFWIYSSSSNFAGLTIRDIRIENFHNTAPGKRGQLHIEGISNFALTLDKTYWYSNQNSGEPGGAWTCNSTGGMVSDTDSTYDTNNASANWAGACYMINLSSVTLTNCKYYSNYCNSYGGACAIWLCDTITIDNCDFGEDADGKGNRTTWVGVGAEEYGGGAISIIGPTDTGNCTITDSRFYRNGGYAGDNTETGGAIQAYKLHTLTIEGSDFSKNYARRGGALFFSTGQLRIDSTKFVANHASHYYGGALSLRINNGVNLDGSHEVDIEIANSLFDGNHMSSGTGTGGGAIYYLADSAANYSYAQKNNTFVNNEASAGDGGAVYFARYANSPVLNSYNEIYWDNVCANYEDIYDDHANCTVNFYNGTYQTGEIGGAGTETISSSSTSDPLFTGGGAYTLQATSPARNTGNNTYISGYSTDLAGNDRTIGTVDMGCYENQTVAALVSSIWGVAFASIAKINGIEIDKIAKVDGVSIKE